MTEEAAPKVVFVDAAIGFRYQTEFALKTQRKVIEAQVRLPDDATAGAVDEALDKIARAMDRQVAYYELELLIESLAGVGPKLASFETQLALIEERSRVRYEEGGRRGEWSHDKLSPQEANAHKSLLDQMALTRAEVKNAQERRRKLEGMLNGHAFDRSADRHTGM